MHLWGIVVYSGLSLGTLRNHDDDGNGNVKKQKVSKTTTLHVHHTFLYISLPSLHSYDVKCPNFKFTWEKERQGDKFYHLCPNLSAFPPLLFVTGQTGIIAKKFKMMRSFFQRRFSGHRRCQIVRSLLVADYCSNISCLF